MLLRADEYEVAALPVGLMHDEPTALGVADGDAHSHGVLERGRAMLLALLAAATSLDVSRTQRLAAAWTALVPHALLLRESAKGGDAALLMDAGCDGLTTGDTLDGGSRSHIVLKRARPPRSSLLPHSPSAPRWKPPPPGW